MTATATGKRKTAESGEQDALCAYETTLRTLQTHPVTGAPLLSAAATTTSAARVAVLVENAMDVGPFIMPSSRKDNEKQKQG